MGVQFREDQRNRKRPWRWASIWVLAWSLVVLSENKRPRAEAAPQYRSAEQQLDLADSDVNYAIAALVLTRDYAPGYDIADGLRSLDVIADRVRALLQQQADGDEPEVRIAAINTVLFHEYNFTYDFADFPKQPVEKRLLGSLLRRGQGTCANLPDLYYAVAERPGFPIYLVEAPQHAFLRYELPGGRHINIEATGRGGEMSDDEYIAEMEIPRSALELGTMMRTLSRKEALHLLVHERTWHLERSADLQGLLKQSALLRALRPNYASVFWNSAIWEVVAGRAQREGATSEPLFASMAEQSFSRAREFTRRAVELGMVKPDGKGEYLKRQIAIREARLGEKVVPVPAPEPWDAVAETERFIADAAPSEHDWATVFLKPSPGDDYGLNEVIATNRYNREVLEAQAAEERPNPALQLSDAFDRYNQAIRQEDRLNALSQVVVLQGGAPIQGPPPPPTFPNTPSSFVRVQ